MQIIRRVRANPWSDATLRASGGRRQRRVGASAAGGARGARRSPSHFADSGGV